MSFSGWIVGPMGQWCQQRFNAMGGHIFSEARIFFYYSIRLCTGCVFILAPLAVPISVVCAFSGHQRFRWVGVFECIELDIMHE